MRVNRLDGAVRESSEITLVHPPCGRAKLDLVRGIHFDIDSDSIWDDVLFPLKEVVELYVSRLGRQSFGFRDQESPLGGSIGKGLLKE